MGLQHFGAFEGFKGKEFYNKINFNRLLKTFF
jgi:hypothetical protein